MFTDTQLKAAESQQSKAAQDTAPQVRLVAGPGTGKSKTIERRVVHILNNGANPENVYVISFTRATCRELQERIKKACEKQPCEKGADAIRVSTMHALALRILRQAHILGTFYPSDPTVLDDWELTNLYDIELSNELNCLPSRAKQIRAAYDADWQTLNPSSIDQAAITDTEKAIFKTFHETRRNLYSWVLPGELIHQCVEAIKNGAIQANQLPTIDQLIVDEYQDLNACDQEFVRLLSSRGAILFVAGDDDQSIYSTLRHADPSGLVNFMTTYPEASTHILSDCFRCSPEILLPAIQMIRVNPHRIDKFLKPLYGEAVPPVKGTLHVWSFQSAEKEAEAIAASCQQLIKAGMVGHEDDILILISDRDLQLDLIVRALGNLGLQYDPPPGEAAIDDDPIRAVYSILRLIKDHIDGSPDYVAHRTVLRLLHGVGPATAKILGDLCVKNNQNFHALFRLPTLPNWLEGRVLTTAQRLIKICQSIEVWSLDDTIGTRSTEIAELIKEHVFSKAAQAAAHAQTWSDFASGLPSEMTLKELYNFFSAGTEAERRAILNIVDQRSGTEPSDSVPQKRIRILTMHGAKGLSGKVVFIPSVEQGIMPSRRAVKATGLLIEQRRLFYVSLTRAMAAAIISHAVVHTGPSAFRLEQRSRVTLPRSQFLNDMNVKSINRDVGLSSQEAVQIIVVVRL